MDNRCTDLAFCATFGESSKRRDKINNLQENKIKKSEDRHSDDELQKQLADVARAKSLLRLKARKFKLDLNQQKMRFEQDQQVYGASLRYVKNVANEALQPKIYGICPEMKCHGVKVDTRPKKKKIVELSFGSDQQIKTEVFGRGYESILKDAQDLTILGQKKQRPESHSQSRQICEEIRLARLPKPEDQLEIQPGSALQEYAQICQEQNQVIIRNMIGTEKTLRRIVEEPEENINDLSKTRKKDEQSRDVDLMVSHIPISPIKVECGFKDEEAATTKKQRLMSAYEEILHHLPKVKRLTKIEGISSVDKMLLTTVEHTKRSILMKEAIKEIGKVLEENFEKLEVFLGRIGYLGSSLTIMQIGIQPEDTHKVYVMIDELHLLWKDCFIPNQDRIELINVLLKCGDFSSFLNRLKLESNYLKLRRFEYKELFKLVRKWEAEMGKLERQATISLVREKSQNITLFCKTNKSVIERIMNLSLAMLKVYRILVGNIDRYLDKDLPKFYSINFEVLIKVSIWRCKELLKISLRR